MKLLKIYRWYSFQVLLKGLPATCASSDARNQVTSGPRSASVFAARCSDASWAQPALYTELSSGWESAASFEVWTCLFMSRLYAVFGVREVQFGKQSTVLCFIGLVWRSGGSWSSVCPKQMLTCLNVCQSVYLFVCLSFSKTILRRWGANNVTKETFFSSNIPHLSIVVDQTE